MYASSPYQSPPTYMYHDFRPQSYAPAGTGNFVNASSYSYATTSAPIFVNDGYSRRASVRPASAYYSTTRPASYYAQPPAYTYATPTEFDAKQATSKRHSFAATSERRQSKVDAKVQSRASTKKQRPESHMQTHYTYKNVVSEESDDSCEYDYSPTGTPPPPYNANTTNYHVNYDIRYPTYEKAKSSPKHSTGPAAKPQPRTTSYTTPQPAQTAQRKPSTKEKKPTSTKPAPTTSVPKATTPKSTAPKATATKATAPKTSAPKGAIPKATAADAARAGIPAGYSYKNWDPTEDPIYLLGSVFDANSLGKWIYDWTVYTHHSATPIADLAGDLWLLLIQLAAKMKRADECMPRIRRRRDRDLIDEFLESGDRLWARLRKILSACEEYMWRAAKKEKGAKRGSVAMGPNSGCEFVQSIFGRERRLEETEKLMTSMRLWSMRFDANCNDILRHPSG